MRGGSYEGKFKIYCHEELADTITQLCMLTLVKKFTSFLGDRILIKKVKDGEEKNAAGMKLTFFDIHSTKTKQFGFRAGFEDGTRLTCLGDEPYKETARPYAEAVSYTHLFAAMWTLKMWKRWQAASPRFPEVWAL